MTWREFKEAVEEQGVTDETEIRYIDTGSFLPLTVDFDTEGEAMIT